MSYDKIWIEIDVEKSSAKNQKSEKIQTLMKALNKLDCVENISAVDYIQEGEKKKREVELL